MRESLPRVPTKILLCDIVLRLTVDRLFPMLDTIPRQWSPRASNGYDAYKIKNGYIIAKDIEGVGFPEEADKARSFTEAWSLTRRAIKGILSGYSKPQVWMRHYPRMDCGYGNNTHWHIYARFYVRETRR